MRGPNQYPRSKLDEAFRMREASRPDSRHGRGHVLRGLSRALLTLMLIASLASLAFTVRDLLRNPALSPVLLATADQIRAATDRAMAKEATPERIDTRLRALLAETPHNWVAIEAVRSVARERDIALVARLDHRARDRA